MNKRTHDLNRKNSLWIYRHGCIRIVATSDNNDPTRAEFGNHTHKAWNTWKSDSGEARDHPSGMKEGFLYKVSECPTPCLYKLHFSCVFQSSIWHASVRTLTFQASSLLSSILFWELVHWTLSAFQNMSDCSAARCLNTSVLKLQLLTMYMHYATFIIHNKHLSSHLPAASVGAF